MAKQYSAAEIRAAKAQKRELSLMAFEHFCQSQQERILREFTGTVTDTDLPLESVEAKWNATRLGPELQRFEEHSDATIHVEVRK